jgi:hypothetical protein
VLRQRRELVLRECMMAVFYASVARVSSTK